MYRSKRLFVTIAAVILLGAGCAVANKAPDKNAATPAAVSGCMIMKENVKKNEKELKKYNLPAAVWSEQGVSFPAGFPPPPPGATVCGSTEGGANTYFSTDRTMKDIQAYYLNALRAAGYNASPQEPDEVVTIFVKFFSKESPFSGSILKQDSGYAISWIAAIRSEEIEKAKQKALKKK